MRSVGARQETDARVLPAVAEQLLHDGLRRLRLDDDPHLAAALVRFIDLVDAANPVYRLVNADRTRLVTHHVLDSLAAVATLRTLGARDTLLDVGSGAGFPGIPLALAMPEVAVTLLERSVRRAAFLHHVRRELPLPAIGIVDRPLSAVGNHTYDLIVWRAVAPLARLLPELIALARRGQGVHAATRAVVYQGTAATVRAELSCPQAQALEARVVAVEIPHLDAERHLIVLSGFAAGQP